MSYLIGVDVGGTFTDCVIADDTGNIFFGKSPSTPPNFSKGIIDAVVATSEEMGKSATDILENTALFFHGSTVATNIMTTMSGSKVGLITTKGFEDTNLIMRVKGRYAGRGEEYIKHMVKSRKPEPIVPRSLIRGVAERVDYKGAIVAPLNKDEAIEAIKDLAGLGVDAIAICFLWSFANPSHELQVKNLIYEMYPDIYVSVSSELTPKIGEYERTSSAVINSYIGPESSQYLASLIGDLKDNGLSKPPLIMQAHGGCLPIEAAKAKPIGMIDSGPVGGLIGAKYLAENHGYKNVITTDVGGTTFDVGLIYNGEPEFSHDPSTSQYSLLTPTIEITSIGAGGGSIAWIEHVTNMLKVGPKSSGAVPGPVCYDQGGTEPTVTDADLLLGYLNPDYFLGGKMKLNKDKAAKAYKEKIADPLGISVEEAAIGVYEIANAKMMDLVRSITVARGHDPRECVLFAFGGAGPVHAKQYGREAKAIIIPYSASVHSALGIMTSDVVHAYEQTEPMPVPADVDKCNALFEQLEKKAITDLTDEGFSKSNISLNRYVDMGYVRQVHEVKTPVPPGKLTEEVLNSVYDDFEHLYEKLYGKGSAYREAGMKIVTFSVYGIGKIKKPSLTKYKTSDTNPHQAIKGNRKSFTKGDRALGIIKTGEAVSGYFIDTDVYDFDKLFCGNAITGPAIIETPITTILVGSKQQAKVDDYKNIILQSVEVE